MIAWISEDLRPNTSRARGKATDGDFWAVIDRIRGSGEEVIMFAGGRPECAGKNEAAKEPAAGPATCGELRRQGHKATWLQGINIF